MASESWFHDTWTISKQLGKGHFSDAQLAINVNNQRYSAIKCSDKARFHDFAKKHGSHLNVHSEALLLQSFSHPGIVSLFHWIDTASSVLLILEYHHSGDLLQSVLDRSLAGDAGTYHFQPYGGCDSIFTSH